MSDLLNGWPEDGEPVTTMSDEEMVEWCNQTQDTLIAQRKEIERLRAENDKQKAVVDAARDFVNNHMDHDDAMRIFDALAALEDDNE